MIAASSTQAELQGADLPARIPVVRPLGLFGALFLIFLTLALSPLVLVSPLPLGDYANHLARLHILANLQHSEPLSRYYEIQWSVIPNLASDLIVPIAMRLGGLGVENASALFVAASLVLIATGAVVLNRVLFGRWSYLSLAIFLLLYNRHFLWGFMNYIFAIGVMLWLMAAWVYVRERWSGSARLIFAVPSTALFICHMFPLGVYGLFVIAYEVGRWWRTRSAVMTMPSLLGDLFFAGVQFLPPLVLLVLASPTASAAAVIQFGSPVDKVLGLLDIFNNYITPLDVGTWLLVLGGAAFGLFGNVWRLHPSMGWPLIVLVVFYLAMPNVLFNSGGADRRLTAAISAVAVASLGDLSASRRQLRIGLLVLTILFTVRMGVIAWNWVYADSVYARHRAAMAHVSPGSRVAYLMSAPGFPWLLNPPIDHIGNLVVVQRDAFVNSLFAEPGSQVVRPRYNTDTAFYKFPSNTYRLDTLQQRQRALRALPLDRFDWVYLVGMKDFGDPLPQRLQQVWRDEEIDAALFKITP